MNLRLIELLDTSEGTCRGRHYQTGESVRVKWREGRISEIFPDKLSSNDLPWIAPALVDLQVNGYNGIDFQTLGNDVSADLLKAAAGLKRDGCARALLTLTTAPWEETINRIAICRNVLNADPILRKTFLGWHIEGPFISSEAGFIGAHNPTAIIHPEARHLEELRNATNGDPLLLTLAPEIPGALPAIRLATELGIMASLGHTNASSEQLGAAIEAGAFGVTHFGNGCPQQLDRHDNILWRVLDDGRLTVGLIPDSRHLSPSLFRLIHRLLPFDRIYWTTDAMAGAGAPPGRYRIGRLEIEIGADGIARQPGKTNFAGSTLRPLDGVMIGARMLGVEWRQVWDHFSVVPMNLIGQIHGLKEGAPSAFCLLQEGD